MNADDRFVVTEQWLLEWSSAREGWTQAQLAALGVSWPPRRGWRQRVIGQAISLDAQAAFEVGGLVVDVETIRRAKPTLGPGLRAEVHACKRAVRLIEERLATYQEVEPDWGSEELWRLWASIHRDLARVVGRLAAVQDAMIRQERASESPTAEDAP